MHTQKINDGKEAIKLELLAYLRPPEALERANNIAQMLLLGESKAAIWDALTPTGGHAGISVQLRSVALLNVYRAWSTATATSNLDAWCRLMALCGDTPQSAREYMRDRGYPEEANCA